MARQRLLTILASTLAAGLVALPAVALPLVGDEPPPASEVLDPVVEGADTVVTTVETGTVGDSGADTGTTGDGSGILPTGEGEPLEPLAPITDPVEEALAPVLDPVEQIVAPAEPVVDEAVGTVLDIVDLPTDALGGGTPAAPDTPVNDEASAAGGDTTDAGVLHDAAPVTAPTLDGYWAGSGVSRGHMSAGRAGVDDEPQVAEPVEQPIAAPAVDRPVATGPLSDAGSSGWQAALKIFAALLVAATGTMWQRAYAKVQVKR